jgi:hypothetical protein
VAGRAAGREHRRGPKRSAVDPRSAEVRPRSPDAARARIPARGRARRGAARRSRHARPGPAVPRREGAALRVGRALARWRRRAWRGRPARQRDRTSPHLPRRRSLPQRHARSGRRRGQHGACLDRVGVRRAGGEDLARGGERGPVVGPASLQRRHRGFGRRRSADVRRLDPRDLAVHSLSARAPRPAPLRQQPPVAVLLLRERVRRLGVARAAPRRGHARALGRARARTPPPRGPRRSRRAPARTPVSRARAAAGRQRRQRAPRRAQHREAVVAARLAARHAPRQDGRRRAARDPDARAAVDARRRRDAVPRDHRAPRRRRLSRAR